MKTPVRFAAAALIAGAIIAITPSHAAAQKRQRDRINRDELMKSSQRDQDLYEAIRALRPRFLDNPPGVRTLGGSNGMAPVTVVVNGARESGIDALRTIRVADVEEVRYLDPTQSENEYGPRSNGGAIVVKLMKAETRAPADPVKPPQR